MLDTKVFVFCGKFKDREEACLYSEPQWESEPDDSVSDEEYFEWEERNPSKKLKQNIDSYLDEDFIETIELDFEYLSSINVRDKDLKTIKSYVESENIFVLVYEQAFGGFSPQKAPVSTKQLTYCGQYKCTL